MSTWTAPDPAVSESFCILPWIHMYVSPDGTAQPCCINRPETSIVYGNVNENSWQEMWNSEAIRQFRLDLLRGKKRPDVCAGCYGMEEEGSVSHRQRNNLKYADLIRELVSQTSEDGGMEELRLYYWDFRFSNLCNLKCRSCGPLSSSRWQEDFTKAGRLDPKLAARLERTRERDFQEFLSEQLPHVRDIYFAGGEPLLSSDHYSVLEELLRRKRNEVSLTYNSNGTRLEFRGKKVIDYWRSFKHVSFFVSVDDVGRRAGYIRSGTDWSTLVQNVQTIRREAPHVQMTAVVTVSIFNVLRLREIHETLVKHAFVSPEAPLDFIVNVLRSPAFLQVGVLPARLRRKAIANLSRYQDELSDRHGRRVAVFDPVLTALGKDFSDEISAFICTTRTWDRVRNERISDFYPELAAWRFLGDWIRLLFRRLSRLRTFRASYQGSGGSPPGKRC